MSDFLDFPRAVKSTISFVCQQVAEELGAERVDLDDLVNVDEVLTSQKSAVLHEMLTMDPVPDPMWMASFSVGAKTSSDPSSYRLIEFFTRVCERFQPRTQIDIYDYSGIELPTQKLGYMVITENAGGAQQQTERSGIRLITVQMRGLRF